MSKRELNTKEQHYADTRLEAESLVEEAKEDQRKAQQVRPVFRH